MGVRYLGALLSCQSTTPWGDLVSPIGITYKAKMNPISVLIGDSSFSATIFFHG
jgi:ATP/ADP translocase